jgi:hypothetical protein
VYDHRFTATYLDCVQRYAHRPEVLGALHQALQELAQQPFGNPRLQTHAVKRAQPGTSYVGNQGHRLVWRRVGNVIILLLFGEHDPVCRRAERLRLEIDDPRNVLRVVDEDPVAEQPVAYQQPREREGRLFMAWNDRASAGFGFEAQEIPVLRRLDTDSDLLALEKVMSPVAWERAMNLAMYAHPDGAQAASTVGAAAEAEADLAAPDAPAAVTDARIEGALADQSRSRELKPVGADELAGLLARPIEDGLP